MEDDAQSPAAALAKRMMASGTGVSVQRRSVITKRSTVGIRACFTGTEVVDWIMKDLNLPTRKEAADFAEILRRQGFIKIVNKMQKQLPFTDDKLVFYKFPKAAGVKIARKSSMEDVSSTMRFFAEMSEGAQKLRASNNEVPTPSKITVSYVMREVAKGAAPARVASMALANIPQDLIVFINRNSGGKAGPQLLAQFRGLLPDGQIIDLITEGGPQKGLDLWAKRPSFRLVVCGGDGTVGWVLGQIDKTVGTRKDLPKPTIAVIPLGTGNDMSRACGWGSSYSGQSATDLLEALADATPRMLDRWKIECFLPERDPQLNSSSEIFLYEMRRGASEVAIKAKEEETGLGKNTRKAVKLQREQMKRAESLLNNYFSIGVDAEIVLGFHELREEHQGLFQGVLVNKGWYAGFSAMAAMPRPGKAGRLHRHVTLEIDGEQVRIPKSIRGLVVMNLPTYGGGRLWGKSDQEAKKGEKRRSRESNGANGSPKVEREKVKEREKEKEKEPEKEKEKEKYAFMSAEARAEQLRRKEKRRADWKEKKRHWREPSVSDGLLEVVGLKGVAHLGAITTGVAHGKRLGQGRAIQLTTHTILPVQVDGEPWKMIPCRVCITHANQARLLFKNAA